MNTALESGSHSGRPIAVGLSILPMTVPSSCWKTKYETVPLGPWTKDQTVWPSGEGSMKSSSAVTSRYACGAAVAAADGLGRTATCVADGVAPPVSARPGAHETSSAIAMRLRYRMTTT